MKNLETSAIGLPGIINSAMEHGVDIQGSDIHLNNGTSNCTRNGITTAGT